MFKKKKFVVSHTSNCGDELNAKTVDAFDLEDCVANEYLNSMKELMNVFVVENADGVLEFEKEDFIKSIDDVGFKVENGEGLVWWGDEGGKVIREVKG